MRRRIQIISAPSILGLKPGGVELLAERLLSTGLATDLESESPPLIVPTLNDQYSFERDPLTRCLNGLLIQDFSLSLSKQVLPQINEYTFQLVLGGDCSILLGIMPALKQKGNFGLTFLDAHADFYEPSKSISGEVADMDLAIVTGRGPELLTNIAGLKPYVEDRNVIHIGQRDAEESIKFQSQQIQTSMIKCFDLETIRSVGTSKIIDRTISYMNELALEGFWIHFDTDVISDEENPAVDYRLPGGLSFDETQLMLTALLETNRIAGMSVTIFNPLLDPDGEITNKISRCISGAVRQAMGFPA